MLDEGRVVAASIVEEGVKESIKVALKYLFIYSDTTLCSINELQKINERFDLKFSEAKRATIQNYSISIYFS